MGKRVIVIAEGECERRSLPWLLAHLEKDDITLADVRIARGRLDVEMARKLVVSAWFAPPDYVPPDKFVILVDIDGQDPDEVLRPFREQLPGRLGPKVTAALQFAYAQWHLEAWYFADVAGLRAYLGRDPGHVDTSHPDEIKNPKQHLRNLLSDRAYTPVVSEEIARRLNTVIIAERSPSFHAFLEAVRNGKNIAQDSGKE
jgi:hypothetical protein